jgi:excisionase family DNA binding protein
VSASPWMSPEQAAEYCGADMSVSTIRKALQAGELVGFQLRPGGRWRLRAEHLDAWLMGETPDLTVPRVARGRAS